jgi:gliding motility-associated protein GldC
MSEQTIQINVQLDENKMPESLSWSASGSTVATPQAAKAAFVGLWDGAEKQALRIDLWTNDMMVDEMADFYFQTFMGMAATYERATNEKDMSDDIRNFAKSFYQKFKQKNIEQ